MDRGAKVRRRRAKVLAGILLLAFVLRVVHVNQPLTDNFSWRQASTAMMALNFYRGDWNIFMPHVDWTGPSPSYQGREFQTFSYATALLWTVLGHHDWVGRLFNVLVATWGVFAFFQLVRRVWDEDCALCAAAMLAVLPGAVFIDRSFLPDPLMLSLLITGFWMLVAYLQGPMVSRWRLVGAIAVLVLALMTKLPAAAALVAIGYCVVWILRCRGLWCPARIRFVTGIGLLAIAPIVAYYSWTIYLASTCLPHHVAGDGNWVWNDGLVAWIKEGYYLKWGWSHAVWWLWTWPVLMLAGIGLLCGPSRAEIDGNDPATLRPRWAFHAWIVGCAVLWLLSALELNSNVWNFHIFNPPVAAFAGLALVRIGSFGLGVGSELMESRRGLLRVGVLLGVCIFFGWGAIQPMYQEGAGQGRAMGLALRELSRPGDLVITIANDVGDPIPIYYAQRRGWVFPPANIPSHKGWNFMSEDPEVNKQLFEGLRAQGAKWLGIVSDPRDDTPGKEKIWQNHVQFLDYIHARCTMVQRTDEYVVYRIPEL